MLNKIVPFYFFVSFAIGIFICYIMTPPPEVIVKFPSPYNSGTVLYHDKANNCYKYKAQKVTCPQDGKNIQPQPIYEDFKNRAKISR
jgi:hypothetical protein